VINQDPDTSNLAFYGEFSFFEKQVSFYYLYPGIRKCKR